MGQGIILLLVLAGIVAYVVARTRHRMGMLVTSRTWLVVMMAIAIIVLVLWATSTR
jgi:predicted PurR-regulated permease PerM